MEKRIGTKVVLLTPMNRLEYCVYRGWQLPENENGNDEGYLVEYTDGGKPNDDRHAGYISWSPKDVADRAYRPCIGLSHGQAMDAVEVGYRVARKNWNGKDQYVFYVPANYPWRAFTALKTVNGEIVPWTASQSDQLEKDWEIVDAEVISLDTTEVAFTWNEKYSKNTVTDVLGDGSSQAAPNNP